MPDLERLRQLRRVVEDAPPERFNMVNWSSYIPCDTAYCAAGWAAVDPWFRGNTEIGDIFRVTENGRLDVACHDQPPTYRLADLFGISVVDASNLFTEGEGEDEPCDLNIVTKSQVLANIDRLLAGLPAEPYETGMEA